MNPFLAEPYSSSPESLESKTSSKYNVDHIINGKEGKMFVGGLSWMSSVESLRAYFERFGEIDECVIMRDAKTKMTRGFGFVTFVNPRNVQKVLDVEEHFLDGKKIDPQIAIRHISPARSVNNICRKVFVGGVPQNCDVHDVKLYFSQFGQVEDAVLKMDYPKKQHRGFGFITFVESAIADLVCSVRFHNIHGKPVECKKAQKKEFVNLNTDTSQLVAQLFNSMTPEQLMGIYAAVANGGYASNALPPAHSEPIGPPPLSPSSLSDEFIHDHHQADYRRRIILKYTNVSTQN